MKAGVIFTGTGPILILTSYDSLTHPELAKKLAAKKIRKFVASEISVDKVKEKYQETFKVIMEDLKQTDDLRVLDFDGHTIFLNFDFKEMGKPIFYEP
jgi:hypothetical protein